MSDQIIILKHTKKGIVKDTIFTTSEVDTLNIDVSGVQSIIIPTEPIPVKTPGKDWFDYTLGVVTILGALIAAYYTLRSIKKLYEKDEQMQDQIDNLSTIADSLEKANIETLRREKLSKKPFINLNVRPLSYNNGGGKVIMDIVNNNPLCNIVNYQTSPIADLGFSSSMNLIPGNEGSGQRMGIEFAFRGQTPASGGMVSIDYITEEGYVYIQEIILSYDANSGVYSARGLQIILKENAVI